MLAQQVWDAPYYPTGIHTPVRPVPLVPSLVQQECLVRRVSSLDAATPCGNCQPGHPAKAGPQSRMELASVHIGGQEWPEPFLLKGIRPTTATAQVEPSGEISLVALLLLHKPEGKPPQEQQQQQHVKQPMASPIHSPMHPTIQMLDSTAHCYCSFLDITSLQRC